MFGNKKNKKGKYTKRYEKARIHFKILDDVLIYNAEQAVDHLFKATKYIGKNHAMCSAHLEAVEKHLGMNDCIRVISQNDYNRAVQDVQTNYKTFQMQYM